MLRDLKKLPPLRLQPQGEASRLNDSHKFGVHPVNPCSFKINGKTVAKFEGDRLRKFVKPKNLLKKWNAYGISKEIFDKAKAGGAKILEFHNPNTGESWELDFKTALEVGNIAQFGTYEQQMFISVNACRYWRAF